MDIQKEQLRMIYESHGINFQHGKVILDLGAPGKIVFDEDFLLDPNEDNLLSLKETISNEIDIEWDLFDENFDEKVKTEFFNKAGYWNKTIGRVYHHQEWVCFPCRQRKYYTYLTLSAPKSQVSKESWEKMALYLGCVAVTLGILVMLGMVTAGMSVLATVAIFTAVAGSCLTAMNAVTEDEQKAASLNTHIGR
jgi:hypothetical protein